jgi:hypothetical protein
MYKNTLKPTGAGTVTINSKTYKCNSWTPKKTAAVVNVNDQNGEHSGAASFTGPETAAFDLQVASLSTVAPTTAAENAATGVITRGADRWFITDISAPQPSAGVWTYSGSAQKIVASGS